nr:MAG: RNA-dependent RNA polymerase [Rhizoctonia solani mitovirus 58]
MKSFFKIFLSRLQIFNSVLLSSIDKVNAIIAKVAKLPSWSDGITKSMEGKRWIKETTSKVIRTRGSGTKYHNPKFVGEFRRYVNVVCWMIGNKQIRQDMNLFLRRVEKIILSSSSTWAFAYLKEAYRLTVRALSGHPEVKPPYGIKGSLLVRRDKTGLPTILPPRLRQILVSAMEFLKDADIDRSVELKDSILFLYPPQPIRPMDARLRKDVVGILTVMTIFRTFKTKVTPTLKTVISPFGGTAKTISMSTLMVALRRLGIISGIGYKLPRLSVGNFIPHRSTKAGPNGSISALGASLDALALLHEPKVLFSLLVWMLFYQGALFYTGLLLLNIVLFGPFYLVLAVVFPRIHGFLALYRRIYYFFNPFFEWIRISVGKSRGERDKLYCGKLSVVYDQAGKARVVASVNWWIQSAFKGLHKSIFRFLETVPTDGTFNQKQSFDQFLGKYSQEHLMSGFDLSAATDRLPIELQKDILIAAGLPGNLWQDILNFPYCAPFENSEDTKEVRYAVGQPMGAYSSWAMLALTHHVIVHVAALNSSLPLDAEVNYAVLGDDFIINHDIVAAEYLEIMSSLGVSISLGKSVISDRFTEFAKTLRGPEFNISPIGAGAVLSATRSAYMFPQLFLASFGNVWTFPNEILDLVKDTPSGLATRATLVGYLQLVIWQLLGLSSPLSGYTDEVSNKLHHPVTVLTQGGALIGPLRETLIALTITDLRTEALSSLTPLSNLLLGGFYMVVSGSPALRVLETLMKPINPGFWVFIYDAFTYPFQIGNKYLKLRELLPSGEADYFESIDILQRLSKEVPQLSIMNLDFKRSDMVAKARYYSRIQEGVALRNFSMMFGQNAFVTLNKENLPSSLFVEVSENTVADK